MMVQKEWPDFLENHRLRESRNRLIEIKNDHNLPIIINQKNILLHIEETIGDAITAQCAWK